MLERCNSLDDLLLQVGNPLMLWFFQRRSAFMSQRRMKNYFWRAQIQSDPDGEYLRLHQAELESRTWSYIWVDWTCMPQSLRLPQEEGYFHRYLQTMSDIIRNCGFMYFYPPFEPRLWIFYEIAKYKLTCVGGIAMTSDIEPFLKHIDEMPKTGVQATLEKHKHRCSYDRDRQYLTSWLELLTQTYPGVELKRYEGTLVVNGEMHTFTPFPQWNDGKYSQGQLA
ncbi:hypothetical protein L207DRAFT_547065 [Hyaloscypha variabilis F]|uniref:Heterokaryon incompatibility domain-containing protein n=1 Tax=Hyaloscypha variabilis (strain UAMH 11265 / GT02V1 / F) TaxID=1149755 RepID=A0A2J6R7N5_HYAVF|nr:hypothetical protein L207DRAFT_547065 [Hyaloscypha variabilis F]